MPCPCGSFCGRETATHDQIGIGHGPVENDETLIFVVFDTNLKPGDQLEAASFSPKQLQQGATSLARAAYTDGASLKANVIAPAVGGIRPKKLDGIATAVAGEVRSIISRVPDLNPKRDVRGLSVLDKIATGDHHGHAALQFCAEHQDLPEGRRKPVRSLILADLADQFGTVKAFAFP